MARADRILLYGILMLCLARADGLAAGQGCRAPAAHRHLNGVLPRTAQQLAAGGPLVIVAIGSSSTAGSGATVPVNAYPSRLEQELRIAWPHADVRVLNRGRGGETAKAMVERFERDVAAETPRLVIWQLGTNAILQDNGVRSYASIIRDGIERLKSDGADVIIMDPQYAPKVIADPDHSEMLRLIHAIAAEEKVPVFDRYAIMRYWVTEGGLTFGEILSPDGLHMNDWSYGCLAHLLAGAIVHGARVAGKN